MRKNLFTLLLAIVACIGTLFAESGTCGENLTWDLTDGVLTISGTGAMETYIYDNSVNKVNTPWFSYRYIVTSVVISEGVTSIGQLAFGYCSGLTSVTLPNSVTTIGINAFRNCKIDKIYFSGTMEEWCTKSFSTSSISSSYALFINGEAVIDAVIPNSVTSIKEYSFAGCNNLISIDIPNSVTSIGESAFEYCSKLTSIEIPNSVTNIGESAFKYCSGLTSVTIPNSVTNIGDHAFTFCNSLTSVIWNAKKCKDFGDNFTPFHYYNRYYSDDNFYPSSISSFIFGDNVEYIPAHLCSEMSNLTSVSIPNSVTSIGMGTFNGCYNLTSIVWNAQKCADFTSTSTPFFTIYFDIREQITSFTFGDDVEYIPAYLCSGMTRISQIIIPNCNIEIGKGAFSNCKLVKMNKLPDFNITVKHEYDTPNSGSITKSIDNPFVYAGTYYYTLNGQKNASLYNLTAGEYKIVFHGDICEDSIVKNITINQYGMKVNGMYYLLDEANHTAIVTYRGTSYSDYNGEYSDNITIPKTITFDEKEYQVTGIGTDAFYGCNNISSITMESETPILMDNCGLSNNCIIYVPYGSLNAYKSASSWGNYTIHVINPSNATSTTGATSAIITLGDTDEAKHIISCGLEGGEEEFAGNVIEYIGLEPNSEYANIPLFMKTKEGDMDNTTVSFTTTALELTTKASKPVSSTTAILLAETNMSDAEVSCGFEYKRNDAPADMDGTKVFCPVASGQMAGRLKNLKDDVYYKYRAFYQSTAGNMYYGDWQYIFTGDVTVEFDPVLYTYTASAITETSAIISGYALAGSEDFTEQGFEYWAESRANNGANAPARKPAALGEHVFVKASGINMRVSLTDLDAGTVYKYRAYAKVGDQIYYGSEQSFTTSGTYTPPTYVITFVNWDGTELQSSPVAENTLPEYTGDQPTRPNDEEFSYSFKGWTPEIVIATEDATYTATFEKTTLTAISNIETGTSAQKVLRNGQIYILRGEKVFTLTGQAVK